MHYPNFRRTARLFRLPAACVVTAVIAARSHADPADASSSPAAIAQTSEVQSGQSQAGPDDIVRLSSFEVRTTKGMGYTAGNSASAMKNNQPLMDTPQNIIEITNDLIADIGAVASTDVLQYAGAATTFRGEAPSIRGNRVTYPYTDDMPDTTTYSDDVDVDTYEVIKGPVQIFYPGSSLGGLVLKTSKKPLPHDFDTVTATIDQWGGRRLTYDLTGPIGSLGDGRWSYRLVGAFQGGTYYDKNVRNDHTAIFPTLEWDWHNTSVILEYNAQIVFQPDSYNAFLTPGGALYTGAGWQNTGQAPNSNVKFATRNLRGMWIQKLSDNWDAKLAAQLSNYNRSGAELYPGSVNYANNTLTYQPFLNNEWHSTITVQDDFSGKYDIGIIPNVSSFGFNFVDQLNISEYIVGKVTAADTIPLGSAAAINGLQVPQASLGQWPAPANPGSRSKSDIGSVYYMHQIDVIPNWLTLVGGFTFSSTELVTDPNVALKGPYAATDLDGHALLHRLAALVHLTKSLMLYAAESTNYTASAGVDFENNPLPPVSGKDDEVGFKTSLWDGRFSSTFSAFKMTLSNQAIVASFTQTNIAGVIYELPIGTTTTRGWDGSASLTLFPGWQLIATGYVGTVKDSGNNPIQNTYGNSLSLFTRYDFAKNTAWKGLSVGAGLARIGDTLVSTGGLTFPSNINKPGLFKLQQGTLIKAFATYQLDRHWAFRLSVDNILNKAYPLGQQGATNIDPSDPRTFSLGITYNL